MGQNLTLPVIAASPGMHQQPNAQPIKALQRTAPCVTAPASATIFPHHAGAAPHSRSLSLGSLDASLTFR